MALHLFVQKKIMKKLNKRQLRILGFENYPPKDEKYRVKMRGKLEISIKALSKASLDPKFEI